MPNKATISLVFKLKFLERYFLISSNPNSGSGKAVLCAYAPKVSDLPTLILFYKISYLIFIFGPPQYSTDEAPAI